MAGTDRDCVERVARIYASNQDAGQALGITMRSFSRLCRQHGIETPYARKLRQRQEARSTPQLHGADPRPEGSKTWR